MCPRDRNRGVDVVAKGLLAEKRQKQRVEYIKIIKFKALRLVFESSLYKHQGYILGQRIFSVFFLESLLFSRSNGKYIKNKDFKNGIYGLPLSIN